MGSSIRLRKSHSLLRLTKKIRAFPVGYVFEWQISCNLMKSLMWITVACRISRHVRMKIDINFLFFFFLISFSLVFKELLFSSYSKLVFWFLLIFFFFFPGMFLHGSPFLHTGLIFLLINQIHSRKYSIYLKYSNFNHFFFFFH